MNRIRITPLALLAVGGVLLTAACSSKPQPVATPEAKPFAAATEPVPVAAPVVQVAVEPEPKFRIDIEEVNRRGHLKDTFFDYNQYDIRDDQRADLERNAAWLKAEPTVQISVAGHCDERGTSQYNMALGERRAAAVKNYLVQLGIDASRIQILSYGNEKPFVIGHDETAWAQNRRDHFLVVKG